MFFEDGQSLFLWKTYCILNLKNHIASSYIIYININSILPPLSAIYIFLLHFLFLIGILTLTLEDIFECFLFFVMNYNINSRHFFVHFMFFVGNFNITIILYIRIYNITCISSYLHFVFCFFMFFVFAICYGFIMHQDVLAILLQLFGVATANGEFGKGELFLCLTC